MKSFRKDMIVALTGVVTREAERSDKISKFN